MIKRYTTISVPKDVGKILEEAKGVRLSREISCLRYTKRLEERRVEKRSKD